MRLLALCLLAVVAGCTSAPPPPPPGPPAPRYDVEPVSGLGFFRDERERSEALLAQALRARGIEPASADISVKAWALAAAGKSPLTGDDCGRPLSRYEARKRWATVLGVAGSASGNVWCGGDGGCELSVYGGPVDGEGERLRLVAPMPREGDALTTLQDALTRLAPPPESEGGGGLGLIGGLAGPQPIQREDKLDLRAHHADSRARHVGKAPEPPLEGITVEQLTSCLVPGDESISLLVEVSAAGAVARCEGEDLDTPASAACGCALVQRARLAPALAGHRWFVSLRLDRRDQLTADGTLVLFGYWRTYLERYQVPGDKYPRFRPKVEHPSIAQWNAAPPRLTSGCFTAAFTAPARITSRWAVWFDGRGRPTKVVEQKGFAPLPKDVAACVAESLKTAQAPCPARAGLWAMADFSIEARDPNAPPKSLADVLGKKPGPADAGVPDAGVSASSP